MKNISFNLILTFVFMLTLSVSLSFPNNKSDEFYSNPLLLNGRTIDPNSFSTASSGKLSIVKGDPLSQSKAKVPFYVYISRGGFIIDATSYAHNNAVTEVEISNVLKHARPGDQLIIDPADKNDIVGRRIIILKQAQLTPIQMQWIYGVSKKGDGC